MLTLPPPCHSGSPASALREYNEGKYEDSLKDFNHLLEKKNDDPRLHFNAGAAAYQSHQLDEAAKQFGASLESPDLQVQQRSYYNLGNTLYRLGQQDPDSKKKQESWENSLKQLRGGALKLNQQDADAKFNLDYVKKQLEELKKQQSQQQQVGQKFNKMDKDKRIKTNKTSRSGAKRTKTSKTEPAVATQG